MQMPDGLFWYLGRRFACVVLSDRDEANKTTDTPASEHRRKLTSRSAIATKIAQQTRKTAGSPISSSKKQSTNKKWHKPHPEKIVPAEPLSGDRTLCSFTQKRIFSSTARRRRRSVFLSDSAKQKSGKGNAHKQPRSTKESQASQQEKKQGKKVPIFCARKVPTSGARQTQTAGRTRESQVAHTTTADRGGTTSSDEAFRRHGTGGKKMLSRRQINVETTLQQC